MGHQPAALNLPRLASATALIFALGGAPAMAAPGIREVPPEGPETYRITITLGLRTGPGTENPIMALLPAGTSGVSVFYCTGGTPGWCDSKWRGYRGWLSACCLVGERTGRPPK